jgi:hypothetical protein
MREAKSRESEVVAAHFVRGWPYSFHMRLRTAYCKQTVAWKYTADCTVGSWIMLGWLKAEFVFRPGRVCHWSYH